MVASRLRVRLVAVAAFVVGIAGLVAVARHDGGRCPHLRDRFEALSPNDGDVATQNWDDIYVLQENVTDLLRLRAELDAEGCT